MQIVIFNQLIGISQLCTRADFGRAAQHGDIGFIAVFVFLIIVVFECLRLLFRLLFDRHTLDLDGRSLLRGRTASFPLLGCLLFVIFLLIIVFFVLHLCHLQELLVALIMLRDLLV